MQAQTCCGSAQCTKQQDVNGPVTSAGADLEGVSNCRHQGEDRPADGAPQEEAFVALDAAQHALAPDSRPW